MTEWTLLIVLLALINMVRVTHSIENYENNEYLNVKYEKFEESSKPIDLNQNLNTLFTNDKPEDYPEKQVSAFFNSEIFKIYSFYFDSKNEYDRDDVKVRMKEFGSNTTSFCGLKSFLQPYKTINKSGKSFIIIQGNFIQRVQVEICRDPNSPCEHSEHLPLNMKGLCEQGFITKAMFVLSEDDGFSKPFVKELLVPHFCMCMVQDK